MQEDTTQSDATPGGNNALAREADGEFRARLREHEPDLRNSELKVARFIMSNPHEAARLSISELARQSSTSEATVNRLSRALGYAKYSDLKLDLVRTAPRTPLKNIPGEIEPEDDASTVADKLAGSLVRGITDTLDTLDTSSVTRAVASIGMADRVYWYGIGGSGHVCDVAQHLFLKAGILSTAYGDGYMQAVSSALVTNRDLVIGISHSGATLDVIKSLENARSRSATTIAITGARDSAITEHADIALITASSEEAIYGDFMEAKVCQLLVIDLLYIAVLLQNVPKFTRQLEETAAAIWDRSTGQW